MMSFRSATMACLLGFLIATGLTVAAQERGGARSGGERRAVRSQADVVNAGVDPLAGPIVAGAPFSGDATTTVVQTLGDGTHIEQRVTAKLYRDGTGRVRREQTIIGLDRLNSAPPQTIITFDSVPGDSMPYILDPVAKVASRTDRALTTVRWFSREGVLTNASAIRLGASDAMRELERTLNQLRGGGIRTSTEPAPIPSDVRPTEEQLGSRQMEGVRVTGRRTTTIIPLGRIGNDGPIRITDERWDSPELSVTVYSRFSDPRTGVVEYRLNNINRSEPRADLFTVPSDYTVREAVPGGRGGGGARSTNPGGRGGRSPN